MYTKGLASSNADLMLDSTFESEEDTENKIDKANDVDPLITSKLSGR